MRCWQWVLVVFYLPLGALVWWLIVVGVVGAVERSYRWLWGKWQTRRLVRHAHNEVEAARARSRRAHPSNTRRNG